MLFLSHVVLLQRSRELLNGLSRRIGEIAAEEHVAWFGEFEQGLQGDRVGRDCRIEIETARFFDNLLGR